MKLELCMFSLLTKRKRLLKPEPDLCIPIKSLEKKNLRPDLCILEGLETFVDKP